MFAIIATMAKINGEILFRHFAMAKIEKKYMANGNEPPPYLLEKNIEAEDGTPRSLLGFCCHNFDPELKFAQSQKTSTVILFN